MKKRAFLFLLCLGLSLAFAWNALAEELQFYTITYISSLPFGERSEVQSKEPGECVEILDIFTGQQGCIFAGWALSPDAEKADYLPDDVYDKDENMTLYAIWQSAYDLGCITGSTQRTVEAFPVNGADVYLTFSVAQSGAYRIRTLNRSFVNATTFSSFSLLQKDGSYWDRVTGGSAIMDEETWMLLDYSLTAQLEAGQTYMLDFCCGPDPITLEFASDFATITYISKLPSYEKTEVQSKEAGVDVEILDIFMGQQGCIFAGWALSPDAEKADYLPGDVYSKDESMTLYAIWQSAYDLGCITGSTQRTVEAFPVNGADVYLTFSVAQSGAYRIRTLNSSFVNATTFSSFSLLQKDGSYWDRITSGSAIMDEETWMLLDYSLTAQLEAGQTYMLDFCCGPDPITLEFANDFATITYISKLPSYEKAEVQSKEAGVDVEILDIFMGQQGYIFAGWALSPDAEKADYLPGDVYSKDENMTLYAIWETAYDLGCISGQIVKNVEAFPVNGTNVYLSFSVAKSDVYRIRTLNRAFVNATTLSSFSLLQKDGSYWDRVTSGSAIMDEETWMLLDYSLTAQLEAGQTYMLDFYCGPDPILLSFEPQYGDATALAAVMLPSQTTMIQSMAFANCTFEGIIIPADVQSIEALAFADCTALRKVVFLSADTVIAPDAFSGCGELLIIAPAGSTGWRYAQENGCDYRVLP